MSGFVRAVCVTMGLGLSVAGLSGAALAEAWVQIEAQPSLGGAEARARDWAGTFPDVSGYAMSTGWYAISLGPFPTEDEAQGRLRLLLGERLIPRDSYVSDGGNYRQQFWPVGAALGTGTAITPDGAAALGAGSSAAQPVIPAEPIPPAATEPPPEIAAAPVTLPPPPVETLADSRRLEAALSREERQEIQTALQWQGYYNSAIDGAFGRGTRGSIVAWQTANGFEPTGVLASDQQAALLAAYRGERDAIGLAPIEEEKAGIAVELPLGLVEFDHYDAPFVHYREKNGSGVRVLLISQQGDQNTLFGLYDVMQTLEIVPLEGERARDRNGFRLSGQNERVHSYTEVKLQGGLIKGFTLVYPPAEAERMARVQAAMQASFRPVGAHALDDTLGKPLEVAKSDLLAGLDVRRPEFAHSGFYVDASGNVLTAERGLEACGRVTVDGQQVDLSYVNKDLGIAVLTPRSTLAPSTVAEFRTAPARTGTEIAVAGYSYPDALSAPVLTFGTLSDTTGLMGEAGQARLTASTLDGDVGGPVLDGSGSVIGLLLPRDGGDGKLLPGDLSLAVQVDAMTPALAENGFVPQASARSGTLPPEDLAKLARQMTVQVSCWQ